MITLNDVSLTLGDRQILKDISLSFFPGAKIGVLGLNGAGKSSLLRIMAGEDTQFDGEAEPMPNMRIGFLPQEPQLDPDMSVRETVEEGLGEIAEAKRKLEAIYAAYAEPDADFDKLAAEQAKYEAQIAAGAQAVQVFDSWVGCLSPADYRESVRPHLPRLFDDLRPTGVPCIHFGTGTAGLLPLMAEAGGDVIGVDWRVRLDEAWALVGDGRGIQGNLDPAVLLGPFDLVERRALDVLAQARGRPGHIFNLGHGVLPDTPVRHLQRLVEWVHKRSARSTSAGGLGEATV